MMPDKTINAKGLQCPGPIVQLMKEIKDCSPREIICIEVTDHAFKKDIVSWCRKTNNELISIEESEGVCRARIRKIS